MTSFERGEILQGLSHGAAASFEPPLSTKQLEFCWPDCTISAVERQLGEESSTISCRVASSINRRVRSSIKQVLAIVKYPSLEPVVTRGDPQTY